jgi:cytochrome P450/NADPH-cytochrome P450 reductase
MHPFVDAMADFLKTSGDRARRDPISQMFYGAESQKYWRDIELLRKTSMDVIKTRRENPTDKKDLLNGMLNGVDSKTGKKMTVSYFEPLAEEFSINVNRMRMLLTT